MLADQLAAVLNQLVGSFLLGSLVVPRTGKGDFHGNGGAYGACAQEEGGVAGDHFSIGEGTYIAHLGLVLFELALLDHLVELHTGGNTCQVTALIDGGKSVVVVGQTLGVSSGAGGVAELHFGVLLGSLNDVRLVTEAVCKDNVAALLRQVYCCVISFLTLRDLGLVQLLRAGDAQLLAGSVRSLNKVQVIGRVLVMQEDEANLQFAGCRIGGVFFLLGVAAVRRAGGEYAYNEQDTEKNCKYFFCHFHSRFLRKKYLLSERTLK